MGEEGKTVVASSRISSSPESTSEDSAAAPQARCRWQRYAAIGVLLAVIVFAGAIRLRLRNLPLERDEGEYAYAGQLMLEGVPPYKLAYNMKLPGTYAMYAAILAVFGQSSAGVHEGLIVVNSAAILLVFLLALRLFGEGAAAAAAASYALLSLNVSVRGLAAHSEHFVVLFALAGLLLLVKGAGKPGYGRLAASGVLLGLAFLMKQPGIFFGVFGWLYLALCEYRQTKAGWRTAALRLGVFSAALALPFALTCAWMAAAGTFHNFWFWTISYARQYGSEVGPGLGIEIFWQRFPAIVASAAPLWILAAAGAAALLCYRPARERAEFVLGLLLFSFAGVCAGFYFRRHYFVLMLPFVALLIGLAASAATQILRLRARSVVALALPAAVVAASLGYALVAQRQIFFEAGPSAASRLIYGTTPFPAAGKIADYIRTHSSPQDRVAVLGSEPEIYFYSGRRSATGYIYTYGLMEAQPYALQMQRQMAKEIEAASPAYVVLVEVPTSWLMRPNSHRWIFSWSQQYLSRNYKLVGVADLGKTTSYLWGAEAAHTAPRSLTRVLVMKRRIG